jgi:hypothetical protein
VNWTCENVRATTTDGLVVISPVQFCPVFSWSNRLDFQTLILTDYWPDGMLVTGQHTVTILLGKYPESITNASTILT